MTNGTAEKQASPKQLKWLRDLLNSKDYSNFPADWVKVCDLLKKAFADLAANGHEPGTLNVRLTMNGRKPVTHEDFQRLLPKLLDATYPRKEEMSLTEPTAQQKSPIANEDGMYKKGDTFYQLKHNQKNNLWAYRLVILMTPEQAKEAVAAGSKKKAVKFKFAGHPLNLGIRKNMKLAYEDMKAFGALYNSCCICGALLSNPLSVALGIGPICGGREFGGEFEFMIDEAKLAIEAASNKRPDDDPDEPEYMADGGVWR